MTKVIAFAKLPGVHPQAAFVSAGADIAFGDRAVPGRLFLASHRGEVAAAAEFEDEFTGREYFSSLAARGHLSAAAEVEDHAGLTVVSRLWLRSSRYSGSAWLAGAGADQLDGECRSWWAAVTVAAMARGARASLPVPVADRPHGEGDPTEITIRGDIGSGQNTASRILALMGNPERIRRTIVVNLDSRGGRCDEGLRIYRALAEWPRAVYCNIKRAESMAAIVALGADVRTIRPDGTVLIHPPSIDGGGPLKEDDLVSAAKRLRETSRDLAGVIALRTGATLATAHDWLQGETRFGPGEALAWGLVHAVRAEDVPAEPRKMRASFAPINGPYADIRGRTCR